MDREGPTRTGAMIGSVSYMAPEQALGEARRVTEAADVWSLGVVLYELLTGTRPFTGPTPMEILRRCVEEDPVPPRKLRAAIDRALETICLTCLRKEPQHRYASAEALAVDLEHWLRGEPIEAERPSRLARAARWWPRSGRSA